MKVLTVFWTGKITLHWQSGVGYKIEIISMNLAWYCFQVVFNPILTRYIDDIIPKFMRSQFCGQYL